MEAIEVCLDLVLDCGSHSVLTNLMDVLFLVFLCNRNVSSTRFQVDGLGSPKRPLFDGEGQMIQPNVFKVELKNCFQVAVVIRINGFHVVMSRLHTEHMLI